MIHFDIEEDHPDQLLAELLAVMAGEPYAGMDPLFYDPFSDLPTEMPYPDLSWQAPEPILFSQETDYEVTDSFTETLELVPIHAMPPSLVTQTAHTTHTSPSPQNSALTEISLSPARLQLEYPWALSPLASISTDSDQEASEPNIEGRKQKRSRPSSKVKPADMTASQLKALIKETESLKNQATDKKTRNMYSARLSRYSSLAKEKQFELNIDEFNQRARFVQTFADRLSGCIKAKELKKQIAALSEEMEDIQSEYDSCTTTQKRTKNKLSAKKSRRTQAILRLERKLVNVQYQYLQINFPLLTDEVLSSESPRVEEKKTQKRRI